jgi:hypothetical protein
VQVEQVTTIVSIGSANSISAKPDWHASLEWARAWQQAWDPQTYADFLAAQVLRYAIQARDRRGVALTLGELRRAGTLPSGWSTYSGLLGFVPRQLAERTALALSERTARRTPP